jgi:hypothetical protein
MANNHGSFYIKILKMFGVKINIDGSNPPTPTPYTPGN